MRIVDDFPHAVRTIEHCSIPLRDGCRLAARIWLPEDAESHPVPAIVEYIPYRKRDRTRARDEPMHRYFAGHGYAAVRIDLRGSGESDGLLQDEYLEQEQDDGVEAIAWIARQPWCSGAVGMMGKSWGGFNSLQLAARNPPELKAILTVCSTDDRYADDAHYMGGCLLNENLIWGSVLLTLNAAPPDPELVGERWRQMWIERLQATPLFPENWLRHQRRDAYWQHGSVCEDLARIRCPVYAVGGWADGYSNAVPRLLAGLTVPRKGLVGPWAHVYPHMGVPGPAIGFLQEALRWWDQWLRDTDTGIMDEPMYRVWLQDSVPPRTSYEVRPGRWVAEPTWPSSRIVPRRWQLADGGLRPAADAAKPRDARPRQIHTANSAGLGAGSWCGFGIEGELPLDQRSDDGRSVTFDGPPLKSRLEILGAPVVELDLAADRPQGFIVVRLNDVAADGASSRVSFGLLNLTHRDGHAAPKPLVPGQRYRVRVQLNDAGHAFPAGHRIRLALSTAYWPMVWPSPAPVTIELDPTHSWLELPERRACPDDAKLEPFGPPEGAPPVEETELEPSVSRRTFTRDLTTGETVYRLSFDAAEDGGAAMSRLEPIDLDIGHAVHQTFRIHDDDPLSAKATIVHRATTRRGEWSTRVETRTTMTATATTFRLRATLRAHEGDAKIFERRWNVAIPRDGL